METATIYELGMLFGHETLSLKAIIDNRANDIFSADLIKLLMN
jgi:hypothetical protein